MLTSKYMFSFAVIACLATSCKKLIKLGPPETAIEAATVFETDISSIAAVSGILGEMATVAALTQGDKGISVIAGLTGDELMTNASDPGIQYYTDIFRNSVVPDNIYTTDIWVRAYQHIYRANAIIEGVERSTTLSPAVKSQVTGEAEFLRAFMYFYLTNLYGPVPIVTSTVYEQNRLLPRMPSADVYEQMITDLSDAQNLLTSSYLNNLNAATTARMRPNKWATVALLARAYLFKGDWSMAEAKATEVIQSGTYSLDANLNNVFKPNATEAIWHFQPFTTTGVALTVTKEGAHYSVSYLKSVNRAPSNQSTDLSNYLNDTLARSFESGDRRKLDWIDSFTVGNRKYFFPYKYKNNSIISSATADYLVLLRLAEQYLIRAEARLMQNNLTGALQDINVIRARAGVANAVAVTKDEVMELLITEKKKELFTEWGHRWFDLKRWPAKNDPGMSRAEEIMSVQTPLKGGTWNKNWLVLPLPKNEVLNGSNITQNPGYPM